MTTGRVGAVRPPEAGPPQLGATEDSGVSAVTTWVLREMQSRRISQRALAHRSGVHHSTISRLLTSSRMPSLETALKLARGLRVTGADDIDAIRRMAGLTNPPDASEGVLAALKADPQLTPAQVALVHRYYLNVRRSASNHPSRRTTE